jgi:hypothetical protein
MTRNWRSSRGTGLWSANGSANSFGAVFYNLWRTDLPVFISTDALLQAWHRTFDALLEETEETSLAAVERMLSGMAAQLSVANSEVVRVFCGQSPRRGLLLAVARSFLRANRCPVRSAGRPRQRHWPM